MSYLELIKALRLQKNPEKIAVFKRFFKTGKDEYGEGDRFFGLTTPVMVTVALRFRALALTDLAKLLAHPVHECRAAALVILKKQFLKADANGRKKITDFYLRYAQRINNWDLVDISAPLILANLDWSTRLRLAKSKNLWERRMAMMSTFAGIKAHHFAPTLDLARLLLHDPHDLIHKAVGWLLREVGKRDLAVETAFLNKYATRMPRTMLRYAIEKFPQSLRQHYLHLKPHVS
jgi:3-methyladenine DNA glycosylase AlkD